MTDHRRTDNIRTEVENDGAPNLSDAEARERVRPYLEPKFGEPIRRFYDTGEITEGLIPALGVRSTDLDDPEAERLLDVVSYVRDAGERPPVTGWASR
ncbi:hypothetical protein E0L36_26790 [Streptomyces sp. AJS327]|uniref:hypothetical protein n=1 Tax=Streptomyces sp. AJS327 TaxID=2545265 RepID=UPI0015DECFD1|nr:hypothetical protein [Streptomyces sp. AJS327]MBA0054327.1 hypothetical protein [Streptomyces sp. AJS327]